MGTLRSCDLEVIHATEDYLVARELSDRASLAQLVIVEVLIDKTHASEKSTDLDMVFRNEELSLKRNNHCEQLYHRVSQAIADNKNWQLIRSVATI
ncbi:hypothetical protein L3556_07560 [Candidatus Synechococcus calcipolaris G9]|uniref:Uncharacterized protein n=1 Tax=Candidatus Synechococcus calcipolaris G9 TaxID=1497997 RepID=A0ABT6EZ16_9SYNE|nr:hypothetical protein [Candidatus Synechococcus calcipolaris]MDG2990786.1 hypothetical protein [Candidatus Synechococcus calcipolaris G9]